MAEEKPLPQLLKIGNHNYVVSTEYDGYMEGAELWGEVSYTNLLIRVRSTLPLARKQEVLVHEMLHAILQEAGVKVELVNDEELVKPTAAVLFRLLRENDFSAMYQGPVSVIEDAVKTEAKRALEHTNMGSNTVAMELLKRLAGVPVCTTNQNT